MLRRLFVLAIHLVSMSFLHAAEWQWSAPDGEARAYLWIPPDCARVRGVVVANHNMVEQGILEHAAFRRALAELGFAEIWVVPYLDATFDFNAGAGAHFDRVLADLAARSGYDELRHAPVVPLGHSACATYPWNFAAWAPERTLALVSFHGDAPRTTLTGNGKPRIDWGDRSIDGIPALMVMGQYEWWEDRLAPAFDFIAAHPLAPVAFLADAGRGHFDYADRTVEFIAAFIKKAAAARLPAEDSTPLRPVDPHTGWRIDRWRPDAPPSAPAAPYAAYTGDPRTAFWCFDEAMARATEAIYAEQQGKLPQLISVTDGGQPLEKGVGEPVTPRFLPEADGLTFRLATSFLDTVPPDNAKATLWTGLPVSAPLTHAAAGGPITLSRIVGPFMQLAPDTFQFRFGRAEYTANRRNHDLWLVATHPGDATHRGMVQQAMVRATPTRDGAPQTITFPVLPDQPAGTPVPRLTATSDAGLPVSYYVREGPAEIVGDTLRFTAIPPRARYPIEITVVAWQFGRSTAPKINTATPVERTFRLLAPTPTVRPGEPWLDDRGRHIQAHGGGILKLDDTYYWFGEDRSRDNPPDQRHVACYSSRDLMNWTFLRQVVKTADPAQLGPGWVLERPKVFHNALTKKFVLYAHLDNRNYGFARVGVFTSDTVDGDYAYLKSFRPLGRESRDIGQFIDDDGSAYLIFEARPTKGFFIAKLSDDYLSVEKEICFIPSRLEGGALVHYEGLYYLVGSALTGWSPNPNQYTTATSLAGPWSEFRDLAPPETKTYGSQSTLMVKVAGTRRTTVIFMADIWKPKTQWDSRYLWMPLEIGGGKLWLPKPRPWSLDIQTGDVTER